MFDGNVILFGKDAVSEPVRVRTLDDARPYLMDRNATSRRKHLYLMYRGPHKAQDEMLFKRYGIRYDITVLFPGTLGGKNGEYIKTIGHTHPAAELYEVLHGSALFILQETKGKRRMFFIKASKGEKVIIPPEFGHITTNIGAEPLILADLFKEGIKSDYSFFKKHRGAAYWVTPAQWSAEGMTLVQNTRHKQIGESVLGMPADYTKLGLSKKTPIYTAFAEDPKKFAFLMDPKKAWHVLDTYGLCYAEWEGYLT